LIDAVASWTRNSRMDQRWLPGVLLGTLRGVVAEPLLRQRRCLNRAAGRRQ